VLESGSVIVSIIINQSMVNKRLLLPAVGAYQLMGEIAVISRASL
jgi:hypothetical protein